MAARAKRGGSHPDLVEQAAVAGEPSPPPTTDGGGAPPPVEDQVDDKAYCSCQGGEQGVYLECSDGSGGCNGWFHPLCGGLEYPEGLDDDAIEKYFEKQNRKFFCALCVNGKIARRDKANKRKSEDDASEETEEAVGATKKKRGSGGRRGKRAVDEDGPLVSESSAEARTGSGRLRKQTRVPTYMEGSSDDADDDSGAPSAPARGGSFKRQNSIPGGLNSCLIPVPTGREPLSIQTVLGHRLVEMRRDAPTPTVGPDGTMQPGQRPQFPGCPPGKELQFLVKWKNMSFLHISWEYYDDLLYCDHNPPTNERAVKRYEQQQLKTIGPDWRLLEESEQPEIDPNYREVHRVISCNREKVDFKAIAKELDKLVFLEVEAEADEVDGGKNSTSNGDEANGKHEEEKKEPEVDDDVMYLVKWQGLAYSDCTWETWKTLKEHAQVEEVGKFWIRQRPSIEELRATARGNDKVTTKHFQKLTESPCFGIPRRTFLAVHDPENHRKMISQKESEGALKLREYQLIGLNWLLFNYYCKRFSILADEMGLGKTIQTMAFLYELYNNPSDPVRGPFMVVAPLSLINQWYSEASSWAPDFNVLIYHGNNDSRQIMRDYDFFYQEPFISKTEAARLKERGRVKFDILLTTYEVVVKDVRPLTQINWKVLIVDEAHRLKNPQSRLFEALQQVPRESCVLLTGTPLQNKTEELWALLNFGDKTKFANQATFSASYGDLKDAAQVASLHSELKPYLLRRVKEDVEKSLPPKEETIIEVTLTPLQKQFYRAIYEKNTSFLFKGAKPSNSPSLMNIMMELRKCCNHAYLNRGVEDRILVEIPEAQRTKETIHKQLVSHSGKLILLDKLLPRLKAEGHKVLIFSQMVKVLDILEDFLRHYGYLYERLDGSRRDTERTLAVARFNNPHLNRFIMLLSTRAGGLGLNLTAADTVIIYDSDWNPHNDLQAQARAHRIGQTKAVMVYRILTKNSYEMEMFRAASKKLGLDRAVLAHARADEGPDMEDESGGGRGLNQPGKLDLNVTEIDNLLKRGAYDVFREDNAEADEFAQADIDQILQRSSHKVVYGGTNNSGPASNMSSFAKASFVSVDNKEDIDLDDPDFWKKAVGLQEPAPQPEVETIVVGEKRQRKQTSRFVDGAFVPGVGKRRRRTGEDGDGDHDGTGDSSRDEEDDEDYIMSDDDGANKDDSDVDAGPPPGTEGTKRKRRRSNNADKGPPPAPQPKRWVSVARDRVLRALSDFGFGRWERIRQESLCEQRGLEEVESFCRSYMLQCGCCAKGGKEIRNESQFVLDAINAATEMESQIASGQISIPEVMTEERFVSRLKSGNARKALMKMDTLLKLQTLITAAVTSTMDTMDPEERAQRGIDNANVEEKVALAGKAEVASRLELGTVRPRWAKLAPWWDVDCDRHLLVGLWCHGYGKYNAVRDDADLCFRQKIEKYLETNPTTPPPRPTQGSTNTLPADFNWSAHTITLTLDDGTQRTVNLPARRVSEYRGVYSQPGSVMWVAQVPRPNGAKPVCLGPFEDDKTAALAYDSEIRGQQGVSPLETNFTPEGQRRPEINSSGNTLPLIWHRPSKYRGVRAVGSKWTAQISNRHLGTFVSEIEAAQQYNRIAKENYAATVSLHNFPEGLEKEIERVQKLAAGGQQQQMDQQEQRQEPPQHQEQQLQSPPQQQSSGEQTAETEQSEAKSEVKAEVPAGPVPMEVEEEEAKPKMDVDSSTVAGSAQEDATEMEEGDGGEAGNNGQGDDNGEGGAGGEGGDKSEPRSTVESHFPDSKALARLAQWLIEDPGARTTEEEMKKQDEEKLQKKMADDEKKKTEQAKAKKEAAERKEEKMRKAAEAKEMRKQALEDKKKEKEQVKEAMRLERQKVMQAREKQLQGRDGAKRKEMAAKWAETSRHRLCNVLYLGGAPCPQSPPLIISDEISDTLGWSDRADDLANGLYLDKRVVKAYSWDDVTERTMLATVFSSHEVQEFYVTQFLPLCRRLVNGQDNLQEHGEGLSSWPDPGRALDEHSVQARTFAFDFMRRQQLLRTCRYFLEQQPVQLLNFLRSEQHTSSHLTGLPMWWKPVVHDLGLIVGSLSQGLLCMEKICQDPTLPFTQEKIKAMVTERMSLMPATELAQFNSNPTLMSDYVRTAMTWRPDRRMLEDRLIRICTIMNKQRVPAPVIPHGGSGSSSNSNNKRDSEGKKKVRPQQQPIQPRPAPAPAPSKFMMMADAGPSRSGAGGIMLPPPGNHSSNNSVGSLGSTNSCHERVALHALESFRRDSSVTEP